MMLMRYSEPSLQRQHFCQKTLTLKWLCCCKESFMSRLVYKKVLVLFLLPNRRHVYVCNFNPFAPRTKHVLLSKFCFTAFVFCSFFLFTYSSIYLQALYTLYIEQTLPHYILEESNFNFRYTSGYEIYRFLAKNG